MPTETVYGLAASIESTAGLRRVFSLKERPFFDPLIVHVASFKQAQSLTSDWSPLADFLARLHWPGPLTLVLPKAEHVNPLITSGLETVGIRYPAHPVALKLIETLGSPVAAPSANKFGRTSPTSPDHVRSEFPDSKLLILDGGECDIGVESTVATIEDNHLVKILRPGAITKEMLQKVLKKWAHPTEVIRETSQASPGHLKHHYMPNIPLVIVPREEPLTDSAELSAQVRLRIQNEIGKPAQRAVELHLSEDPSLAARELYSEMRRLAETGADCIFVRKREAQDGLWSAIWDRLNRAASLDLTSAG